MRLWRGAFFIEKEKQMPNEVNKELLQKLREKVKEAKSITMVDYQGLKSNDFNDFRQKIRDLGAETVITKNTLITLAMREEGIDTSSFDNELKGPNAIIFGYDDAISYFKTIFEFADKLELPKVKLAIVEGSVTNAKEVKVMSELPSRDQLLAQVVGGLKSPLSGLVNVLGGTQSKFVTVLSRIAEKKEWIIERGC